VTGAPAVGRRTATLSSVQNAARLLKEFSGTDRELGVTELSRRLGLGKVIGTRTWGGEVWLSQSNFLVDRGIATAAETEATRPSISQISRSRAWMPAVISMPPPVAGSRCQPRRLLSIQVFSSQLEPVMGRPRSPRSMMSRATRQGLVKCMIWPTISLALLASPAAMMALHSATDSAIGFSSSTCLPASRAAIANGACRWCGAVIATASTALSSISRRQSV